MGKDGFLAKKNGLFGLWQQKKARDNNVPKKTTPGHLFVLFKDFSDSVMFRSALSGEYQDQVPTPIPEIKPMRALWISLALCLVPGLSRADVVVYEQNTFNSGMLINNVSDSYGQAFTNTAGNVAVKSVTFYFAQQAGATSGNLSVSIYAAGGFLGSYIPTGSALVTSQTKTFTTGENIFDFVSATTLSNSTYVAVLNLGGLNLDSSNTFDVLINPLSGSQYATSNGVYYNGSAGTPTWVAQAYQIRGSVVMVPEPGTLLLGGIAAACGGGGVWWRRRRQQTKQPAATETAG